MPQRIQYQKCGSHRTEHASVRERCFSGRRRRNSERPAPKMRHSFPLQQLPRGWSSSSFLLSISQGCRGGISAVGTFGRDPWAAFFRTVYFSRSCVATTAPLTPDESLRETHHPPHLFQAVALAL